MVTSGGNWAQLIKHANELAQQLSQRQQTLATAESCTGGGIGYLLTEIAGSSSWFNGGLITYTNALKQQLLGVSSDTLAQHGAVSQACVEQMAQGAIKQCQSDWAIAVSGIAGPGGGSLEKPVGLVWMAICHGTECSSYQQLFAGDRSEVRLATIDYVLNRLLEKLQK
ncbi:nicotinamide-nucleotide amidase [Idiomarina fontislapidosi]|uniref:Damage-inducible protein CinA n=1 Tax=Idiomarina fontislapidosi TaxID=263723 RepID=A0A432YBU4_9GAMM|nr:CinA family protein [Idiomarina fontislapidosi]PYE35519.1 nicotinamide-nucleotide amidase [Idiomarina fontislapidosi]RUO58397.1 damage-inducible protein CinA [Idiomarina fontislapidosi]|tara:strand:+ start:80 stop:583 length:504 start_codon:yes stop_codon:yes gene_type:complete